ncbi:MAG TPA: radical SAM protein, partial [Bacteroidales bacterium]
LFLTESCNLACSYCFVKDKKPKKMSLENIFEAINFLVFYSGNKNLLNITLFGGEPLMEKENIYKILEKCENIETQSGNKKFSISITTNGTLLDEEVLRRTQGKINYLLSIDGDEETHDSSRKYANGKGSFKTILPKIQLLKKYQPWLGARMTITPDTVSRLAKNIEYLHSLGINQFLLGLAVDIDWDENSLELYEKQLFEVGGFYISKRKSGESIRITNFEKDENGINCHEHRWGCGAGRNTISVNTDGEIYPCSKFLGYEGFNCEEMKLGDIHTGITNIKLRAKMSQITDESFSGCSGCSEMNACLGGCPADNYFLNRNIYKPGISHCELTKINNKVKSALSKEIDEI